jgi:hypothetical protein
MENITFDWLDSDYPLNYELPRFRLLVAPEPAKPAQQPNEPISQVANMHYYFSN